MLKVREITKKYSERDILKNISLDLASKGFVFIIGESGAGKSSLLNVLGLLDSNYEGRVQVNEKEINKNDSNGIHKYHKDYLNFIFQEYNLINTLTVKENIVLSVELTGREVDQDLYLSTLKKLKIDHLENRLADQLSGGEKQRVAIARALCRKNPIILADEPTGNLDKENANTFFDLLKELASEHLIVVISHNENAALKYGDRVIRISDGVIVEDIWQNQMERKENDIPVETFNDKISLCPWLYRLTIANIKKKRRKIYPSIVIMVLCLLTVGIVIGVYSSMNNIISVINTSIFENDKITILDDDADRGYNQIDKTFYNEIINNDNVDYAIEYYQETVILTSDEASEKCYAEYNVVDYSEKFENRYEDLYGSMPKDKDEIVISKSMAETLFNSSNCIGKTITMKTISSYTTTCTIVGYRENDEDSKTSIYISKELADEISSCLITLPVQTFIYSDYMKYSGVFDLQVLENKAAGEYSILYGRDIQSKEDAVLLVNGINEYLAGLNIDSWYSLDELLEGNIGKDDLEAILSEKISLTGTIERTFLSDLNIVGIAYSKDTTILSDMGVIVDSALVEELSHPINNSLDIYIKSLDDDEMDDIYNLIEAYGYSYNTVSGSKGFVLYSKLSTLLILLSGLAIVMIFITFFMIHYTTKINVYDRIYEVGVEKSLGASNGFIFQLFLCNNVFIGFIAGIIASVILAVIMKFELVKYNGVTVLNFQPFSIIIILICGVMISALAGLLETYRIARKSILQCIGENRN